MPPSNPEPRPSDDDLDRTMDRTIDRPVEHGVDGAADNMVDGPSIERLARALDAYDQARAAGETDEAEGGTEASSTAELAPEELERFTRVKPVVDLLHRAYAIRPADGPARLQLEEAGDSPRRFGRFEIARELGRGGFGVVLLARDPVIRRDVALKIPSHNVFLDPALRRRFLREAEAAGRLAHPNIVRVLEAGEVESSVYVALEAIDGPNLAAYLKERTEPLPVRTAALIIRKLAEAVAHAHEKNVLHRDIKPGNVLLAPVTGGSSELAFEPKLTDFGLARLADTLKDETRTGAVLGTPRYMAPEQASGDSRGVGPAADIYSLGTMLYELLVGRTPFLGETDLATYHQVVHEEPVAPRRLRGTVAPDMETICLKCLEKRPEDRYRSARELAADLSCFLEGRPIAARPTSRLRHLYLWARRQPVIAGLGAAVVLAVIALIGFGTWYNFRLNRALAESQRHEERISRHLYAGDMRLAFDAWKAGDRKLLRSILERHEPSAGIDGTDERGIEWWLLNQITDAEQGALWEHEGEAYSVATSADGTLVASAGQDGAVRVGPSADKDAVRSLKASGTDVNCVTFSPDGKRLATASEDKHVRLWDVATLTQVADLGGGGHEMVYVCFVPGTDLLVAGDRRGDLHGWDLKSDSKVFQTRASNGPIEAMAVHGPERLVATAGDSLSVWRLDQGTINAEWTPGLAARIEPGGQIHGVDFSPDGKLLAATGGPKVRVWDWRVGRIVMECESQEYTARGLEISPDGRLLATANDDRTVRIWDMAQGKTLAVLRGHTDRVWNVAFDADGNHLFSASRDGSVRRFSLASVAFANTLNLASSLRPHRSFAVTEGDRIVAMADGDQSRRLFVLRPDLSLERVVQVDGSVKGVSGKATCSDIAVVMSRADRERVYRWNPSTETRPNRLVYPEPMQIEAVAISPEGKFIAWGDGEGRCYLRSTNPDEETKSIVGHQDRMLAMEFIEEGKRLVTAGQDGWLRAWSVPGLEPEMESRRFGCDQVAISPAHVGKRFAVSFNFGDICVFDGPFHQSSQWRMASPELRDRLNPAGNLLALYRPPGVLCIWDVERQRAIHSFDTGTPGSFWLEWTGDGKRIVTVRRNDRIQLWDAQTGQVLATTMGGTSLVALAPDGGLLATAAEDATVRLFDCATLAEIGAWTLGSLGRPRDLAFAASGTRLCALDHQGKLLSLDPASPGATPRKIAEELDCHALAPIQRTDAVLVGTANGLAVVDLASATIRQPVAAPAPLSQIQVAASGDRVAFIAGQRVFVAQIADDHTAEWSSREIDVGADAPVKSLALTPGGSRLAVADGTRTIRWHDLTEVSLKPQLLLDEQGVHAVTISPDGRTLMAGTVAGTCSFWHLETLTRMYSLKVHFSDIGQIAVSADGSVLTIQGEDRTGAAEVVRYRLPALAGARKD